MCLCLRSVVCVSRFFAVRWRLVVNLCWGKGVTEPTCSGSSTFVNPFMASAAVCWTCGVDASRVGQLEDENSALRTQLAAALALLEDLKCGLNVPPAVTGASPSARADASEPEADDSLTTYATCGEELPHPDPSLSRTPESKPPAAAPEWAVQRSPHLNAVRGFTAAGLADAEAAEESQQGEMEVKVADAPRRCSEVVGACTIVRIRTFDRPGLLVNLSAVFEGVDLSIARALFHTSEQGVVCNEFWVQQTSSDGRMGPVFEGVKRRAIEQRVLQWSADQKLEPRARDLVAISCSSGELLTGWAGWQVSPAMYPAPCTLLSG